MPWDKCLSAQLRAWSPAGPCVWCLLGGHPAHGNLGSVYSTCLLQEWAGEQGAAASPVGLPCPHHPALSPSSSLLVQISLPSTMSMTTSDGTQYSKQMHFHWAEASSEISGSEPAVDGMRHISRYLQVPLSFKPHSHVCDTFFFKNIYLFIYWLSWVFATARLCSSLPPHGQQPASAPLSLILDKNI